MNPQEPLATKTDALDKEESTTAEKSYFLKTVDNALRVLESFDPQCPEMGITEISERVGLHKSVVFRILHTLMARGYIEQIESSRKFRLGIRAFEIGSRAVTQLGLGSMIQPIAEKLATECGETVNVGVLSGRDIIYVNKVVPRRILRLDVQAGARLPAHCTALGKCILAFLPEDVLESFLLEGPLPRFTEASLSDPASLKEALARIRRQGYAWSNEELFEGITCVSAPIRDRRQQVIAAISIAMQSHRARSPERREELIELVTRAADEMTITVSRLP
jgi:DNA-binding IclR family transcriptional regulator